MRDTSFFSFTVKSNGEIIQSFNVNQVHDYDKSYPI